MSHPSSPPLSSPLPFPSLSLRHPSLSAAMDYETNFYHYTLQVKKGSWECAVYAGFDFYVASTGSSIIAPPGTLVHWAPDEMLSWHRYQSPYVCPSPMPDVQEGACAVAAGVPSLPLLSPHLPCFHDGGANNHIHPSIEWCIKSMCFVSGAFIPAWPLWVFLSVSMLRRTPCFYKWQETIG